jgi:CubicO group peptidase (beta-lactamase class C family)
MITLDPSRHPAAARSPMNDVPSAASPTSDSMAETWASLDELFEVFRTTEHIPGLVYGVVRDGALVHVRGLGVIEVERQRPVDRDTHFRIASMTKCVAALSILMLRDAGRLALDEPVGTYVPEFAKLPPSTIDSRPVSVRDLLNHVSGLVTDDPWADRNLGLAPDEFSQLIEAGDLYARPPGVAFEYSNLGYGLLGRAITNVTGRPFREFITDELLRPLGMRQTTFDYFSTPEASRAVGYRWAHDRWEPQPAEPDGEFGVMGGLVTTAEDYGRFTAFLLSAWPPRGEPERGPVRRASVRELGLSHGLPLPARTREADGKTFALASAYGFGMVSTADPQLGRYLHHLGGLPGYGSHVLVAPDVGVGLFAFGNRTYAPMDRANVEAALLLQRAGLWRTRPIAISTALRDSAEAVAKAFSGGRIEAAAAHLSPNLLLDEPAEERDARIAAVRSAIGQTRLDRIEARHDLAGRFVLVGEGGCVAGEIALTPGPEPKIQRLTFDDPT